MKRNRIFAATAAAGLAMLVASPAAADRVGCPNYQPGLLAFVTGIRPANCSYQGDYMVKQGPTYDGPALVAPQPTYAPAASSAAYMYGPAQTQQPVQAETPSTVVRKPARPVKRVKRAPKRPVVTVEGDLPAAKGKPKIIRATAEVRIYGPERMEIRLKRR
jgi:hypothetical protein